MARVPKPTLSDDLTERLLRMIRSGGYQPGDRLPAIMEMARSFGVGHPTLREALRKLEVIGAVDIRHGSGVYVKRGDDMLLVSNPTFGGGVTKALLLDLVEARMPVETRAAALAATHADDRALDRMAELLTEAEAHLGDQGELGDLDLAFHHEIAVASGNEVLAQLQEVLAQLFQPELRLVLDRYGSHERDRREHAALLEALRQRDPTLAGRRMHAHLSSVRDAVLQWDPDQTPLP